MSGNVSQNYSSVGEAEIGEGGSEEEDELVEDEVSEDVVESKLISRTIFLARKNVNKESESPIRNSEPNSVRDGEPN